MINRLPPLSVSPPRRCPRCEALELEADDLASKLAGAWSFIHALTLSPALRGSALAANAAELLRIHDYDPAP